MVDFGEFKDKVEDAAEKHAGQVDEAIDKAAGMLGAKFGHESEVAKGAEKLKDLLPGEGEHADAGHGGQHHGEHPHPHGEHGHPHGEHPHPHGEHDRPDNRRTE